MEKVNKYYKISQIIVIVAVFVELIMSALVSQLHNSTLNSISLFLSFPMVVSILNYIVIFLIKYKKEREFLRANNIKKPTLSYLKLSFLLLCGSVIFSMLLMFLSGLIPFFSHISLIVSMFNFPLFVNLVVAAIVSFFASIFKGSRIIIIPWKWW